MASPATKSRIESLSDLIFGLALSIGALALIARPVTSADDLTKDVLAFAYGFIILIVVWLRYTAAMTRISVETPIALRLNVLMLFLVSLEPYLFNQVFGPLNIAQQDPGLFNFASAVYAVDLGLLFGILSLFEHFASKARVGPPTAEAARSLRSNRDLHIVVAAFFLLSAAPPFGSWVALGQPVRILLWIAALAATGIERILSVLARRRPATAKGPEP